MIEKVEINGYQSLYKVEVNVGNFTVIYGESDVGKSAFYRAIRGLVAGESGDSFISKGQKTCKVGVTLDTGETVTWVKKETRSGEYTVKADSKEQHFKRSRRLPVEVARLLRFGEIEVDGERVLPNFHGQFDPLFLLFETSGRRARLIGSLISNILLYGIRQANVERNRNEADVRSLSSLLEGLEKHEAFDWNKLLAQVKASKKVLEQVQKGKALYSTLEELLSERTTYEKLTTFSISKISSKVFTDLDKLVERYDEIFWALREREEAQALISSLENDLIHGNGAMGELGRQIKECEKKLTFKCPHCGKEISKLEIDI